MTATAQVPGPGWLAIVDTGLVPWPEQTPVTLLRREVVVQAPWSFVPGVTIDRIVGTGRVVGPLGRRHTRVLVDPCVAMHLPTHAALEMVAAGEPDATPREESR